MNGKMLGRARRGQSACWCAQCRRSVKNRHEKRVYQNRPQRRWEERQWRKEMWA